MARQKEFDRDEALHKAMEVFWARGYEGASLQDLVTHMGINRQSIYDTFGDKHSLFLQALDLYRELQRQRLFEILEKPGSVKKNIRSLFDTAIERSLSKEGRRGCFMGNAMSEMAGRCRDTEARTCDGIVSTEKAFQRALMRGKQNGEFTSVRDPQAVARFLFSSLQGLLLMAKAKPERETLTDIVKVTLSVLD